MHEPDTPSKSSVYDMDRSKKKTLGGFIWSHLESPILLICIGISSALLSYALSFAGNFSEHNKAVLTQTNGYMAWILYSISNISLAMLSLYATFYLSPEAVGGGIADMKLILSGSVNPSKLSLDLLAAKFTGLAFALASGLSVGKEGPLVQMTSAIAEQLMLHKSFNNIHLNTSKRLEILACACASGVSSTFGAAYGGVLYSIEVTCTTYMARNLPRAYLSSIVGMLVFLALGATSHITLYTKENNGAASHQHLGTKVQTDEMLVMVALGVVCGLFGVVFVKLVRVVCVLRNRFLHKRLPTSILSRRRYIIVCTAAALVTPLIYLEQGFGSTTENSRLIDVLFRVKPVEIGFRTLLYFPVKFIMTIICVTLPLPVGIFSPVFLLGGVLGRILGHFVEVMSFVGSGVTPRDFALIGAAAFATGVTRAISTAVIVYELSGRAHLHLPLSVAILVAYFTANRFSKSVYDVLIECSGTEYLHALPSDLHSVTAAEVMLPIDAKLVLDLSCTYRDATTFIDDMDITPDYCSVLNVALVQNRDSMILIGTVNVEAMKSKLEDGGILRNRAYTIESEAPTAQSAHIRRFLTRMRSASSFAYGEMSENYYGHERIKFVMLKEKGAPLVAVTTSEAPGWEWKDVFEATNDGSSSFSTFDISGSSSPSGRMIRRSSNSFADLTSTRVSSANDRRAAPVVRVDPSPYQIDSTMHLNKIDSLIRMLKLNELYVTRSGRLVGIITRRSLSNFIGDREKRPMDTLYEFIDLVRQAWWQSCGSVECDGYGTSSGSCGPSGGGDRRRSSLCGTSNRYDPIPTISGLADDYQL